VHLDTVSAPLLSVLGPSYGWQAHLRHRQLLETFKLYRPDRSSPCVAALFYWLKIGGGCGIMGIAKGAMGRTLPTATPFAAVSA